jgi:hypothetical protein
MAHVLQMSAAAAAMSSATTAARSSRHQNWRLELFFKSQEELQRQLPFLQRHGICRVNLTNKTDKDDLLSSVKLLQTAIPDLDVCVHYSIKYNYDRSAACLSIDTSSTPGGGTYMSACTVQTVQAFSEPLSL